MIKTDKINFPNNQSDKDISTKIPDVSTEKIEVNVANDDFDNDAVGVKDRSLPRPSDSGPIQWVSPKLSKMGCMKPKTPPPTPK